MQIDFSLLQVSAAPDGDVTYTLHLQNNGNCQIILPYNDCLWLQYVASPQFILICIVLQPQGFLNCPFVLLNILDLPIFLSFVWSALFLIFFSCFIATMVHIWHYHICSVIIYSKHDLYYAYFLQQAIEKYIYKWFPTESGPSFNFLISALIFLLFEYYKAMNYILNNTSLVQHLPWFYNYFF